MGGIVYTIAVILIGLWLIGLVVHIGGSLIHILLVLGLIVLAYQFIAGRRTV